MYKVTAQRSPRLSWRLQLERGAVLRQVTTKPGPASSRGTTKAGRLVGAKIVNRQLLGSPRGRRKIKKKKFGDKALLSGPQKINPPCLPPPPPPPPQPPHPPPFFFLFFEPPPPVLARFGHRRAGICPPFPPLFCDPPPPPRCFFFPPTAR